MASSPPFTLTNESITVVWEGKPHTVQKSSPNFNGLRKAIVEERWDDVPNHLTVATSLNDWAKGKFTLQGNTFYFEGAALPHELNRRIVSMATKGESPEPLFKFWERLQKNPSYRSVNQLFPFLQHQGIPLTEDGCFLAYKGLNQDYTDCHSGKFDNHPGKIHEMPRNQISDDPKLACHDGFHVGALQYARGFSKGQLVICKVDPADVVCVPYDESQQKMRVCKYEVIGNANGAHLPSTTYIRDDHDPEPRNYFLNEQHELPKETKSEEEDLSETPCDECNNMIPDAEPKEANKYHKEFCSLYEGEAEGSEEDEEVGLEEDDEDESEAFQEAKEKAHKKQAEEKKVLDINTAKRKSKKGFAKFDKLDMEGLMKCSIDELRQYAGKGLQIIGASKIPGGKTALVSRILEVRK